MGDETELSIELSDRDDDGRAPEPGAGGRPGRLLLGLVAVLALLAVAAVAGGLLTPDRPGAAPVTGPPARVADPMPTGAARIGLEQTGFAGAVGGSLAGDPVAVAAVRAAAVRAVVGTGEPADAGVDVLLLWAGDLEGGRYAVLLVQRNGGGWAPLVLFGTAGTAAALLTPVWPDTAPGIGLPRVPVATFVHRTAAGGAAFVIAPRVAGVEIASARRFLPGGRRVTTWRPLAKQGAAVWVGPVSTAEEYLADYRVAPVLSGHLPRAQAIDGPDDHGTVMTLVRGGAAHTAEGDRAVNCSTDAARANGASAAEEPVLASTTPSGPHDTVAATVLRSPEGAWLWGLCAVGDATFTGHAVATERWGSPDAVVAVTPAGPHRYVVLGPAGAARIRAGTRTTPVRDRLAVVTAPASTVLTVLDREGAVLTRLRTPGG